MCESRNSFPGVFIQAFRWNWMFARVLAFALVAALGSANAQTVPATMTDQEIENNVRQLLARMTLAEKLGQLQQVEGTWAGGVRPEQVELARKGLLGSAIFVHGAARTTELQRVAMTQSKLKIPILFAFDVIHGYRTIFPVPLGEAASWDSGVVERADGIAASEASAAGIRWTFAPMVDIARDPRWGRIVEGSGEDPFLGAAMAAAAVRGFQGTNYGCSGKVLACAKHFVAYGAAEGGRDYNNSEVSERTLREIYFPPFKSAVDAGAGSVMSAFEDLDGIPCTANSFLLTEVLRHEWHFKGIVISDWNAVDELISHGVAANGHDAAALALSAGVDVDMVSRLFSQYGEQLVAERKVPEATIDRAAGRVLFAKYKLDLFAHPYADESVEKATLLSAANRATARELAARTFVLLKNDHITLPLSNRLKSMAVIGPLADDAQSMIGPWSGDGRPNDAVTLLAGIRAKVPQAKILYAKGCDVSGDSRVGFKQAIKAASKSDFTILAVGESADMSGEATSRSSLDLPGQQLALVQAIHALGKPYAVVLMNGRPLSIDWIATNSPAVLETWFAGTEGGNAIADTLFGDADPGGKLPVTFPRSAGQTPIYYNHKNTGRPPGTNKDFSGYRDIPWTSLYSFGYGLSYAQFKISNLQLSAARIQRDGTVTIGVDVENTGDRPGDEVVQLYIHDLVASVTRPVEALKGFERVSMQPGQSRHVEFRLGPQKLGFYNQAMRFVVEPGRFGVMVSDNSQDGLKSNFEVIP
ncbi:MAG TPA: glycoside hydrolase family 3 N-terminal domain-containing protein [Verrucomicrobiae bacterium]|jgi:beta-glucosidase|nr:glycoside hydrolase family 3 N-terminal domain-containing protein [Verrucomicrobiae bacterium]